MGNVKFDYNNKIWYNIGKERRNSMIIMTKPAQEKEKEKYYYSGFCTKCGAEFVCEESDFIIPIFNKHFTPFIRCPNIKCNKMIHKEDCKCITKKEYIDKLPPLEKLKRISLGLDHKGE